MNEVSIILQLPNRFSPRKSIEYSIHVHNTVTFIVHRVHCGEDSNLSAPAACMASVPGSKVMPTPKAVGLLQRDR